MTILQRETIGMSGNNKIQKKFVLIQPPSFSLQYKKNLLSLFFLFLFILLGGCQQAERKNCKNANWHKEAYILALKGYGRDIYKEKNKECLKFDIKINKDYFFKGYEKGASQFCQPRWAYKFGLDNQTYKDTCPQKMEKVFFKNYFKGQLHYHQKKLQNKSKELAESNARLWRKRNEYEFEANTNPEIASKAFDQLKSSKAENTRIRWELDELNSKVEILKKKTPAQ